MSSGAAIEGIRGSLDSILGVRDKIALLHPVYLVTRTWPEGIIGRGEYTEDARQMLPSPGIKRFATDLRLREGGVVKQGDVLLKAISKNKYPALADIDCSVDPETQPGVERFYRINDEEFSVVVPEEKYLTWEVLLRRRASPTRG